MRILFVLPYGPSATRVRARMLLNELTLWHDVTLVALAWNDSDRDAIDGWRSRCEAVHAVEHRVRPARLLTGDVRNLPLQYLVSRSLPMARLVRSLLTVADAANRSFDVIHVEHMRGAAAVNLLDHLRVRTVYDAVDCLTDLAEQTRLYGPNTPVRQIARFERNRTARLESQLIASADLVTVVAERDRRALVDMEPSAPVVVVSNGVDVASKPEALTAAPHAIFTGKLSYHANASAARLLIDHIWPLVRLQIPGARLTIAGADPPRWMTGRNGGAGIVIVSNPESMAPIIRDTRVALAPMVYSVGIQNKVLEAMAQAKPVVATTSAAEGLLPESRDALVCADNAGLFAREIVRLLTNDDAARNLGQRGWNYVRQNHRWPDIARRMEYLYLPPDVQERAA